MFFCLFRRPPSGKYPDRNFTRMFRKCTGTHAAKLRCVLHYFRRLAERVSAFSLMETGHLGCVYLMQFVCTSPFSVFLLLIIRVCKNHEFRFPVNLYICSFTALCIACIPHLVITLRYGRGAKMHEFIPFQSSFGIFFEKPHFHGFEELLVFNVR